MFRAGRFRFMRECSLKRSADFVPGACARTRSIPRSETGGAEAPRLQKPREKEKEAALKGRLVKQEGRSPPHRAPRPRHKSTKKSRGTMYRAPTLEERWRGLRQADQGVTRRRRRGGGRYRWRPNSCSGEHSCRRKSGSSRHRADGFPNDGRGGDPSRRLP